MTIVFLACFVGGLLLAVRVMIAGVERPREEHPSGERSFRLSPPMIVAFAIVFGGVGYGLSRRDPNQIAMTIVTSAVLGVIAAAFMARWVKQWWAVTPEHEIDDERYQLQGHLAQVTKPIDAGVDGEVVFEVDSERRVLRARNFEDGAIPAGTDVVIERIEDEIAYVEAWQEVEKRL